MALVNYEHSNKTYPPGMTLITPAMATQAMPRDAIQDPGITTTFHANWVMVSLAFMENPGLYRTFDMMAAINLPGQNNGNINARGTSIPGMLCPTDSSQNRTNYNVGNANPNEGENWARGNYAVNAGNIRLAGPMAVDSANPAWGSNLLRGVMACNDQTMDSAGVRDGTSNTILAGEIRAGINTSDRRGVWAMGMAGASILAGFGSSFDNGTVIGGSGTANGPNVCSQAPNGSDDIYMFTNVAGNAEQECMFADSQHGGIATVRSLHPNGANVVFGDNSVHFISNAVETSGWGGSFNTGNQNDFWPVWDRLICSSDKHAIDFSKL